MVAAVLLLQLATAPPDLGTARAALEAADTSTALAQLQEIAMRPVLSADGLAALFLVDWIARGRARDDARVAWREAIEHHRTWWANAKRGALVPPVIEERRGDLLQIVAAMQRGRPKTLEGLSSTLGHDWRDVLARLVVEYEADDSLLAAAARWVMLGERLASLDSAAERFYVREGRGAIRAGLVAQDPPGQYRLLAYFAAGPHVALLDEIGDLTAALAQAPWPFDALAARAHVTLCALLRANTGVAGCWPDGRRIGGRDGEEIRAMVYGAQGRHGLAARVMDEAPDWFVPLDARRAMVDPPVSGGDPTRRTTTRTFWQVAWPLYLQPYNERLTVHRVRLLLADASRRLVQGDRSGLFSPLGDPMLLVRVGVPLAIGGYQVFVSRATHETIVRGAAQGQWAPLSLYLAAGEDDARYQTGFVSEDYDELGPRDHQLVAYLRGDQRWVDIYTAWQHPVTCDASRPLLGMFLLDQNQQLLRKVIEIDLLERPRKRFRFALRPGTYVYSLELLDPPCRTAERARYVIRVPEASGLLSDLVLADELHYGDERRAADRLRDREPVTVSPSLVVPAGGVARFYWEMYGVTADSTEATRLEITFEVVNVREGRVLVRDLRAVADAAARTRGTLDLTYRLTVPPGAEPLVSGLTVGIPEDAHGTYIARLKVTDTATGSTATAQRAF
ncbi:MAG: hypothetical protein OEW06_18140, partial [Gemmatimonadota bacterium]|nr:hypothetical protein [Gemmatimonadota bacterium]